MSFESWMSRMRVDMCLFHCVSNDKWEPCYVTIGFFETTKTNGDTMDFES